MSCHPQRALAFVGRPRGQPWTSQIAEYLFPDRVGGFAFPSRTTAAQQALSDMLLQGTTCFRRESVRAKMRMSASLHGGRSCLARPCFYNRNRSRCDQSAQGRGNIAAEGHGLRFPTYMYKDVHIYIYICRFRKRSTDFNDIQSWFCLASLSFDVSSFLLHTRLVDSAGSCLLLLENIPKYQMHLA